MFPKFGAEKETGARGLQYGRSKNVKWSEKYVAVQLLRTVSCTNAAIINHLSIFRHLPTIHCVVCSL